MSLRRMTILIGAVAGLLGAAVSPASAQQARSEQLPPPPPPPQGAAAQPAQVQSPQVQSAQVQSPQVPAPQPEAAAAPPPAVSAYRINPGDDVEIYVWGEDRLQRTVRVLPDGTFAFPLVGQIAAQGKLPQDIEALVHERLRSQYRGQVPQVTVSVRQPSGMQFSVMGKVNAPGTFTPGRYVNVIEALSLAGGPAQFANLDDVLLIRKQGDRLNATRIRLGGLFKSGNVSGALSRGNLMQLQTGDTLIVP